MVNSIDSNLYLSSVQEKQASKSGNTLGQDAFLKLLITQLQNQDPLNPMEDTQFISQMASFSSLEQMMGIKDAITELKTLQKDGQLISYNHFLGKDIVWHRIEQVENSEEIKVFEGNGKIVSIQFKESGPLFYLEDGTELTSDHISQIANGSNESSLVQASYLIGKRISWAVDGDLQSAMVQAVTQKNGQVHFQLNDDSSTIITGNQILSVELV